MKFNDVFFVMQKQSGGQTPGLLKRDHLLDIVRSRPLNSGFGRFGRFGEFGKLGGFGT